MAHRSDPGRWLEKPAGMEQPRTDGGRGREQGARAMAPGWNPDGKLRPRNPPWSDESIGPRVLIAMNLISLAELDSLRQWQFGGPVDGVGLTTHVGLP